MTKEELVALGLSAEQADKVLTSHKQAIDGAYIPKHRFDEVNTQMQAYKDQVKERDTQIKDLKKFEGTAQELQTKITELETQNTTANAEYQKALAAERKRNAIKMELLQDAEGRPHDADMVLGLFNLDTIAYDETNGKITSGFKEQKENLKKEKAFLFAQTQPPQPGKPKGFAPAGQPPIDGDGGADKGDPSTGYGKSLAQTRLAMMGVKPVGNDK